MIFNPSIRTRRVIATLMAAGMLGGTAAGTVAVTHNAAPQSHTVAQSAAPDPAVLEGQATR
jgi:hypothetical protein